jgi:CTD kinase subunit alpha
MARSPRDPPMKGTWKPDEDRRVRDTSRHRDPVRGERRPRSPPVQRREKGQGNRRGPLQEGTESYRPGRQRDDSRDSRRAYNRQASPPSRRDSRPPQPAQRRERQPEPRSGRSRNESPRPPSKRRRTQSPSPARSDHYVPDRPSDSRSWQRPDSRDRRPAPIDRAFSPRRASPARTRPSSRGEPPSIDSYVPGRDRRDSPHLHARVNRKRSRSPPHRRARTPPSRKDSATQSKPPTRDLSPYSARLLKTKELSLRKPDREDPNPIPVGKRGVSPLARYNHNRDGDDTDSMAGYNQNYGVHNNVNRGNSRPWVDTRQNYGGSPPFHTPNSSYQGSPQSGSPYHGGRGGWYGQQQQFHSNRGYVHFSPL